MPETHTYRDQVLYIRSNRGSFIPLGVTMPTDTGVEQLPLAVLIHGYKSDMATDGLFADYRDLPRTMEPAWRGAGLCAVLASRGIIAVRVNLAGTAYSTDSFRSYSLTSGCNDVWTTVRYLEENYPVDRGHIGLVGHSMGGRMACLLASAHADRIRAIALLAPAINTAAELLSYIDPSGMLERTAARAGFAVVRSDYYGELEISQALFQEIRFLDPVAPLRDFLAIRPHGALVLTGGQDTIIPSEQIRASLGGLDVTVREFSEADHDFCIYEDRPAVTEDVLGTVADFLDDQINRHL